MGSLHSELIFDNHSARLEADSELEFSPQLFVELSLLFLLLKWEICSLDECSDLVPELGSDVEIIHRCVGQVDSQLKSVLSLVEQLKLIYCLTVQKSDE